MAPIADCFASICAKVGVTGVAGVTKNTVILNAVAGVLPFALEKTKQSQSIIALATPVTPETPLGGHNAEYWQEMFEERAAIMEFDGGVPRAEAERMAQMEVDALRRVSGVAGVNPLKDIVL